MTEQERAFWQAVYIACLGRRSDYGARVAADQAIADLRASEATLADEAKAAEEALRGEPPFKAGDRVELLNSISPTGGLMQARVTHHRWDEVEDTWRFDVRLFGHTTDTMDIAAGALRKEQP